MDGNENGFHSQQEWKKTEEAFQEENSFVQQEMAKEKGIQTGRQNTSRGSVLAGVICAILGALIGGVVWVLMSRLGYIVGIAGFLSMFLAIKGYSFGTKQKAGKAGTVLCFLLTLIVVALATCTSYAIDLHTSLKSEMGLNIPVLECFKLIPDMLKEPDISKYFIKDLAVGILFAVLACASMLLQAFKKPKQDSSKNQNLQ